MFIFKEERVREEMALTKEIMGGSIFERSSSSKVLLNQSAFAGNKLRSNQLFVNPISLPLQRRRVHLIRKAGAVRGIPVAAISEDLVKAAAASALSAEKAVKFKVRAVLTVRKNIKEDFKEKIVNRLDAITDKIGRNVVLELISTEVDPSK